MKKITFIHAADLHLDSPFVGLRHLPQPIMEQMKEAIFVSFQRIVQAAIDRQVDFLLLAGDLFDGENRNLRTQVRLRNEMERLKENSIDVYIIHGNHDHLGGSWIDIRQPENVHIFKEHFDVMTWKKEGATVHIYGYSYPTQHVKDRIIQHYRKKEGADYHIGMLHGNLQGETEHGQYAPFTLAELQEKQFDYWALGHIHKRQELLQSPPVIYPGNIQGRSRKETGMKGCYYVELEGRQSSFEFIATSPIVWESLDVEFKENETFDDLFTACRAAIQEKRDNRYQVLASIMVHSANTALHTSSYIEDLLQLLQEEEEKQPQFVFPVQLRVEQEQTALLQQPVMALIHQHEWTQQEIDQAVRPIFKHSLGRKYIDTLTSDEKRELKEEAEKLLALELSIGGEKS
ncbi:metallophosphoesterase family protein [Bacillus testis]|uniref:metallophosphoesterase family protein n=1 Tax=Bacillus testis TaxID=1622072 RepID=UPI00067F11F3|nr:DNA repair exonuclease [Bacillus testis]